MEQTTQIQDEGPTYEPFSTTSMPENTGDTIKWTKPITKNLRQSRNHQKYIQTQKQMGQIEIDVTPKENESPREAHQGILKKIATAIGADKIDALYQTNYGKIIIATKSEKQLDDIIKANIEVEDQIINITPVIKRSLLVTLDCPFYIADEEITEELEMFGTIRSKVMHETYSWANTIKSGKRKIYISPTINILDMPHYVRLDGRKFTIFYEGKGFFCKYCGENKPHDHKCEEDVHQQDKDIDDDIYQQDKDIDEEIKNIRKDTTNNKHPIDEQEEPNPNTPPEAPQSIETLEKQSQPIKTLPKNNNNNNNYVKMKKFN